MQRKKGSIIAFLCIIFILIAALHGIVLKKDETKTNLSSGNNQVEIEDVTNLEEEKATEAPRENLDDQEDAPSTLDVPTEGDVQTAQLETEAYENEQLCTLSVRCDEVLSHLDRLTKGKKDIIPINGIILAEQKVSFREGDSVFDVLYRTLKEQKIHFEFVNTPMFDSVYIEGIGNLYEFDCGELSGWLYKVNGMKPTYGCSQYKIQKGDKIEVLYTCNYLETLD